jgi:hypothetical protein
MARLCVSGGEYRPQPCGLFGLQEQPTTQQAHHGRYAAATRSRCALLDAFALGPRRKRPTDERCALADADQPALTRNAGRRRSIGTTLATAPDGTARQVSQT